MRKVGGLNFYVIGLNNVLTRLNNAHMYSFGLNTLKIIPAMLMHVQYVRVSMYNDVLVVCKTVYVWCKSKLCKCT
jgi:hypothetical protein